MKNSTEEIETVHCVISGKEILITNAIELKAHRFTDEEGRYYEEFVHKSYADEDGTIMMCETCGGRTLHYDDNCECENCADKRK